MLAATRHSLTEALRTARSERACFQPERDTVHAQCEHWWPMSSISIDYLLQVIPQTRLYPKLRVPVAECGLHVHVKATRKPPRRHRRGQAGALSDVGQLWRGTVLILYTHRGPCSVFCRFCRSLQSPLPKLPKSYLEKRSVNNNSPTYHVRMTFRSLLIFNPIFLLPGLFHLLFKYCRDNSSRASKTYQGIYRATSVSNG